MAPLPEPAIPPSVNQSRAFLAKTAPIRMLGRGANPFVGPQPYTIQQRAQYFGRTAQVRAVTDMIQAFRFATVFGLSGAGKSSLIQAGVLPRLIELGWRMVHIDAWPDPEVLGRPALAHLVAQLQEELGIGADPDDDLTACVVRSFRRSPRPVVIVLDQLEQLIEYHDSDALQAVGHALQQLEAVRSVPLHVVLSLREDYLGRWTHMLRRNKELTEHRYRIARFTVAEMHSTVRKALDSVLALEADWPDDVLASLIEEMTLPGQVASDEAEIEAAFCQIVFSSLFDSGGPEYGKMPRAAEILESYLDRRLSQLGGLEDIAWRLLEDKFVSRSGLRAPVTRAVAVDFVGDEGQVDQILQTLEAARVLRAQQIHGQRFFELGHDTLAHEVKARAEARRAAILAEEEAREAAARMAKLEAQRRRDRITRMGALLFALVMFVVAMWVWRLKGQAEDAQLKAVRAMEEAREERKVARDAETEAHREKALADAARDEAKAQFERAEKSKQEALAASTDALHQRDLATAAQRRAMDETQHAHAARAAAQDALKVTGASRVFGVDPTLAVAMLREVAKPENTPGWLSTASAALLQPVAAAAHLDPAEPLAAPVGFGPGGRVLLLGQDRRIHVWLPGEPLAPTPTRLPAGATVAALAGGNTVVQVLGIPGRGVVVLGTDHPRGGRDLGHVHGQDDPTVDLLLSADGRRLVARSLAGRVRVWWDLVDAPSGSVQLEKGAAPATAVAVLDTAMLIGRGDGRLERWERSGGWSDPRKADLGSRIDQVLPKQQVLHQQAVVAVRMAEQGVRILDASTLKEVQRIERAPAHPLAAAWQGDALFVGWSDGALTASEGAGPPAVRFQSPTPVTHLAVSGGRLAWGGPSPEVSLAELPRGLPRTLKGHHDGVRDLRFGPDGTLLVTAVDGTVRVWDPQTLEVAASRLPDDVDGILSALRASTTACVPPGARSDYLSEAVAVAAEAYQTCRAGASP